MTQFMEHRARYLILAIIILTFINITEVYMVQGEERELLTNAEIEERIIELGNRQRFLQSEIENRLELLKSGQITHTEYVVLVSPLLDEQELITAKIIALHFHRTEDLEAVKEKQMSFGGLIIGFFTIEIEDAPHEANLILSLINGIFLLISALVIASFIYDGIKALPFT